MNSFILSIGSYSSNHLDQPNRKRPDHSDLIMANIDDLLPEASRSTQISIHIPSCRCKRLKQQHSAADRLRAAGFDVTMEIGKTGVVGMLQNGNGPVVMLRADMDALPVQEATGLPYTSKATATD